MDKNTSHKSTSDEANQQATKDIAQVTVLGVDPGAPVYRLYKRRFVGMVILNMVSAMASPWFGPISNKMVSEFGITLDQVNWLGNAMACMYLPVSLAIPEIIRRYGIRRCCDIGAAGLLASAWIRYAGTVHSLSTRGAYGLLIIGQFCAAIAQPIFQVIGPKYSETWFDFKGRTTATMILSIANPIGGALGQLISPIGSTRHSILVLAIIASVGAPFVLLVGAAPPTPPTYSASKDTPGLLSLARTMLNKGRPTDGSMTLRERLDFVIVVFVFGVLAAAVNVFGFLSGEILHPLGYSAGSAGLMGATLILSGIVAALVSAPLFDRVLTSHLAITAKVIVPVLSAAWLSLIWAARPNNSGALFAIFAIIGVMSITMLPVMLELACEITRNADGSSALLWFACNGFVIIFVLVEGALRAGLDASPPQNMRRALIFNGVVVMSTLSIIFFLRGQQTRKQIDQEKLQQSIALQVQSPAKPAGEP
ncbi:major facilitator superfamily domain-containing protein [Mycena albidolilacea]|uniref:Major facilitator superfamily domain-containing protein n=1 Tax=Mycena albidolilacea TaxID=1033008 RepID=A0AAD7AH22_9AGAR|nr:major facilitator superfamily domain-containing protein [Mycena albidolilacea]